MKNQNSIVFLFIAKFYFSLHLQTRNQDFISSNFLQYYLSCFSVFFFLSLMVVFFGGWSLFFVLFVYMFCFVVVVAVLKQSNQKREKRLISPYTFRSQSIINRSQCRNSFQKLECKNDLLIFYPNRNLTHRQGVEKKT